MSDAKTTALRGRLTETIAPLLADGRTAGCDGIPRVGRATRKKAEAIADAVLAIFTTSELSSWWCRGFNAYHSGWCYGDCPKGDDQLREQWKAGWMEAEAEDREAKA